MLVNILPRGGQECRGNLISRRKVFKVQEIDTQSLHTRTNNITEQPPQLSMV